MKTFWLGFLEAVSRVSTTKALLGYVFDRICVWWLKDSGPVNLWSNVKPVGPLREAIRAVVAAVARGGVFPNFCIPVCTY